MATYLINELTKPGGAINIIDHLNIHVLPIANPDGYEYSRNSERLWRKTRSDTGSSLGCMGVDGNRNWDYHWGGKPSKLISIFRYSNIDSFLGYNNLNNEKFQKVEQALTNVRILIWDQRLSQKLNLEIFVITCKP